MSGPETTPVWDLLVRICHWGLVAGVVLAFLTAEELPEAHELIGYAIGSMVGVRLVWGLVGPRHARFSDFVYRPSAVFSYLHNLVAFRSRRYLGHSPAGGAMVVAILLLLTVTVSTGIAADSKLENTIPTVAAASASSPKREETDSLIAQIHGASANLLLLFVGLHISGVFLASVAHRENLVRAMLTGRKRAPHDRTPQCEENAAQ